jgi:hypothetical protein
MTAKINTKSNSKNIDTLLAQCEVTLDTVLALNAGQQAEAWAMKALREAKDARGSFDAGQFEYVMPSFAAATEAKTIARQFI